MLIPVNPGVLSAGDLANYQVREVEALCAPHRTYRVCGMPPSSSGGIAVAQILTLLAHHDIAQIRPGSTAAVHLFSEAGRLAFADRTLHIDYLPGTVSMDAVRDHNL